MADAVQSLGAIQPLNFGRYIAFGATIRMNPGSFYASYRPDSKGLAHKKDRPKYRAGTERIRA